MRLVGRIGGEPDERAALERDRLVEDFALADVDDKAFRQRIGAVPGRHLEQPQECRQRLRAGIVQQNGKDRQALRVLLAGRNIGSTPPASPRRSSDARRRDRPERRRPRAVDRHLQLVEPQLPRPDALVVLEHGKPAVRAACATARPPPPVVAAVAEEDVMVFRHRLAPPRAMPVTSCVQVNRQPPARPLQRTSEFRKTTQLWRSEHRPVSCSTSRRVVC